VDVTDGIHASSGRENPREGRTDTRDAHVEIEGQAGRGFYRKSVREKNDAREVDATTS
jgi:hypothetical protein